MQFLILVKATKDSEAGVMPEENLLATMASYHEELARAGVLLDASGLQPSSKGWRIKYSGAGRTFVDGPFAETKELVAGYTLIQTKTREEAMEWTSASPTSTKMARSRSANCSSWTISVPARRLTASARWGSSGRSSRSTARARRAPHDEGGSHEVSLPGLQ
jgi:hypothetical protein